MSSEHLTIKEIEKLGYYDFMAYLEVPFFNIGGTPSVDILAERCKIDEKSHLLEVGCGTGGNAAFIAEHYGCRVTGIDISTLMIEQAKRRASKLDNLQLDFHVGDAYSLDFPDDSFDVVLTIFVSQFLDIDRAFLEFLRVLKPGGYLGVNEMYRQTEVPEKLVEQVDDAEKAFRDLTDLPFRLRPPDEYKRGFEASGFTDVNVESFSKFLDMSSGLRMVKEIGGWRKLFRLLWRTAELGLTSKKIWERYARIDRAKKTMIRDKETSKYFGYVIGVGRKPLE